jgi:hypothetical protein
MSEIVRSEFSPITDNRSYDLALKFIVGQAVELGAEMLGKKYYRPSDAVEFYSRGPEENVFLWQTIERQGGRIRAESLGRLCVEVEPAVMVEDCAIRYLGVRYEKPLDCALYQQAGHAEFTMPERKFFSFLGASEDMNFAHPCIGAENNWRVELAHPDFKDVLGIVVNKRDREELR